jgi:hypothetical protein
MSEDNKKNLSYSPDLKYEEDYYSDGRIDDEEDIPIDPDQHDSDITGHIQETFDHLTLLIPILPLDIQTVINQVFKPIFNEWYLNLKPRKYPVNIPNDGPIIKPKPPGDDPGDRDPDPPIVYPVDPWTPEPPPIIVIPDPPEPIPIPDPVPPDPIPIPDPGPNTIPPVPIIYTPEPEDPVIPPYEPEDPPPGFGDDDDIFVISTPFVISYEEYDPIEKMEMEFTKNLYDLIEYYVVSLAKCVNRFYLGLVTSIHTANRDTGRDDMAYYIINQVSFNDAKDVADDLRHLVDTALRGEVNGDLKLSFCSNNFSLENTLYHMKNFKMANDLRIRYEKENASKDGTDEGSISDRILSGLKSTYDKKYDAAYINLYKYLNSSTIVLNDVFNLMLMGIQAKETYARKGGFNK